MPPGELSGGVPGMSNGQDIVRQAQDTMKGFTLPGSPGEAETAPAAERMNINLQSVENIY